MSETPTSATATESSVAEGMTWIPSGTFQMGSNGHYP
jgi:formylglycine-generating enzyme required for sulfatase activity